MPAPTSTPDGAKNALILGAILVVFATIVNMLGVKVMSVINNFGVIGRADRLLAARDPALLHFSRGPGVVTNTLNTGAGHSWGYFGAFLIGGIMSAYVMYGFDTAGTLAEETRDPRRAAPPAILRALATAAILGGLLILFALMAVKDINDKNIGLLGLPYIVKQALRQHDGERVPGGPQGWRSSSARWRSAPLHPDAVLDARDGRLPGGDSLARVSGRAKVPIIPALFVGVCSLALLQSTSPTSRRS